MRVNKYIYNIYASVFTSGLQRARDWLKSIPTCKYNIGHCGRKHIRCWAIGGLSCGDGGASERASDACVYINNATLLLYVSHALCVCFNFATASELYERNLWSSRDRYHTTRYTKWNTYFTINWTRPLQRGQRHLMLSLRARCNKYTLANIYPFDLQCPHTPI
jgi:hypothetical protein